MSANRYASGREALGVRLRELRQREGISGSELARRFGWAQSKVSRIETGRQTASEQDIRAWADAVDADQGTITDLLQQLREARAAYGTWRQGLAGQANAQRDLVPLDRQSAVIRNFEVGVVPGLLQTAEYARHRFLENIEVHGAPPDDLDNAIRTRMERQQILYDSTKRLEFVMTEGALTMLLCPVDVLRGQLDRILALLGMSHLNVGIIPTGSPMPVAPLHGFAMFDDLIIVETFGGEIVVRDVEDAQNYINVFDRLREASINGEEARSLIGRLLAELDVSAA